MNIITEQQHQKTKSMIDRAKSLYESFKRCPSQREFLLENGNTDENEFAWNFMALNESMSYDNRFTFENGMYIPGLTGNGNSKLSLDGIYKMSESKEQFVETVETNICESKLMFEMTEKDRENLGNLYESFSKHSERI